MLFLLLLAKNVSIKAFMTVLVCHRATFSKKESVSRTAC